MCACSRENNPAPNLATLLQGTASTPAVVIDSSPSPGGRGHGRAPCPGAPAAGARGRRTRPGAALWAASSPAGAGKRRGRDHSSHQGPYGEAGQHDPSQDPVTGAEPRTVPPDAPVTLVDAHNIRLICTHTRECYVMSVNQRYRIAVQGVAAEPSASSAGRASAVLDETQRCREHRGARTRHRRARHA